MYQKALSVPNYYFQKRFRKTVKIVFFAVKPKNGMTKGRARSKKEEDKDTGLNLDLSLY